MSRADRDLLAEYVAITCQDIFMAQGAGGNVSLKHDDTLQVKASGLRLADAADPGFFVEVPLEATCRAVDTRDGDFLGQFSSATGRPSLEAYFHAIIPHRYVLHLHQIDILALLVRDVGSEETAKWFGLPQRNVVSYAKPGIDLAVAIAEHGPFDKTEPLVLLLQNHGVIVAAATIAELSEALTTTITRAKSLVEVLPTSECSARLDLSDARLLTEQRIADLACKPDLCKRLCTDWALYPDHVVFLGSAPRVVGRSHLRQVSELFSGGTSPQCAFVEGLGVCVSEEFNENHKEQLLCYAEVLCRQPIGQPLRSLAPEQISELIEWEAESYRRSQSASG